MKKLIMTLMLGLFPVLASAQAADAEIADLAVGFIAGYIKADEKKHAGHQWIVNSPVLTKEFKSAYSKYLGRFKEEGSLASNPILNAQDTPDSPETSFRASSIKVTGDHAKVKLTVDVWPGYEIRMQLVRTEGKWLINAINKINWQQ